LDVHWLKSIHEAEILCCWAIWAVELRIVDVVSPFQVLAWNVDIGGCWRNEHVGNVRSSLLLAWTVSIF
jgi:hypothetical protein